MTAAYKFAKREHAKTAVDHGRIRLSHVATFRESDGVDDGRSDSEELTASAAIRGGDELISSADQRFPGMFTVIRNGKVESVDLVATGESVTFIDSGLLYCTSLENSDELFNEMVQKFGFDAAFEISDIDEFARLIQAGLAETEPHLEAAKAEIERLNDHPQVEPELQAVMLQDAERKLERLRLLTVSAGPVRYYDNPPARSVAEMKGVDPFRKPRRYEWQREHRIVVKPFDGVDAVDLMMPALCSLLRIVR